MSLREQIIFHAKVATDLSIREAITKLSDSRVISGNDARLFRQLGHDFFGRYTTRRLNSLIGTNWELLSSDIDFLKNKRKELWQ